MERFIVKYHPADRETAGLVMAAILRTLPYACSLYQVDSCWGSDRHMVMNKIVVRYCPRIGSDTGTAQLVTAVMAVLDSRAVDKAVLSDGNATYIRYTYRPPAACILF